MRCECDKRNSPQCKKCRREAARKRIRATLAELRRGFTPEQVGYDMIDDVLADLDAALS